MLYKRGQVIAILALFISGYANGFVLQQQQQPSARNYPGNARQACEEKLLSSGRRHTRLWGLSPSDLMDMDIVIYSEKLQDGSKVKKLACVQDDLSLTPLSAWSEEPFFDNSLEFVVAEEDLLPGLDLDKIEIESLIPEESLSYGNRQVGGGKGLHNPHGEHSELVYYVDRSQLEGIEIVVNPELEILW